MSPLSSIWSTCWLRLLIGCSLVLLMGCDSTSSTAPPNEEGDPKPFEVCPISNDGLVDSGLGRDGIPALTNPPLVGPNSTNANYLADTSRVIGLLVGDKPLAVPHNILWHHEIVNLDDWADRDLAVTYCPLTGSSLAFDRSVVDGAEFGVSGLLLDNNLMMYDRRNRESLWPQMSRQAKCGANTGDQLTMIPVVEMQWHRWTTLHPETKVLSARTGHDFLYKPGAYPYGNYERLNNDRLLFEGTPIDDRRPPKERVLGIPNDQGGIALPFGELDEEGPRQVVEVTVENTSMVVFWDRKGRSAMAYETMESFSVENERIVDEKTGSIWTVDGRAVEGPRTGAQLEPVDKAYVAFWFAWAVFQPKTRLWTNPGE